MKRSLSVTLLFVLLLPVAWPAAGSDGADAIRGRWRTEPTDHGHAHVEITAEGDLYDGRIVWLSEPDFPPGDEMAGRPKVDRLNPDPALRGRPILGLRIMEGFRHAGDGRWSGGRVYDPESGKTYKGRMRLTGEGTLEMRGYIGFSLLGRTAVWERPAED